MRGSTDTFDLRAALMNELQAAQDALSLGDDTQAVHRCRVAVKRARAVARLGRIGAPGLAAVFNDSAKALMADLAAIRSLDALAQSAVRAARAAHKKASAPLLKLATCLRTEAAALPPRDRHAAMARLKDLRALAQVWPEPSPAQVRRGAKRILKRARRAFDVARGRAGPEARHEWRKREKDRLYIALLLGAAWPEGVKRRRKRAQRLGHWLGEERDVLLLIERLEDNPAAIQGARKALKALDKRRARFAKRADKLGARVHRGGA